MIQNACGCRSLRQSRQALLKTFALVDRLLDRGGWRRRMVESAAKNYPFALWSGVKRGKRYPSLLGRLRRTIAFNKSHADLPLAKFDFTQRHQTSQNVANLLLSLLDFIPWHLAKGLHIVAQRGGNLRRKEAIDSLCEFPIGTL